MRHTQKRSQIKQHCIYEVVVYSCSTWSVVFIRSGKLNQKQQQNQIESHNMETLRDCQPFFFFVVSFRAVLFSISFSNEAHNMVNDWIDNSLQFSRAEATNGGISLLCIRMHAENCWAILKNTFDFVSVIIFLSLMLWEIMWFQWGHLWQNYLRLVIGSGVFVVYECVKQHALCLYFFRWEYLIA